MAMSVASVLVGMRGELKGNVKFAFQPAEETAGGALGMIESGALEDPKVDAALALHIINGLEVGKVGVRVGGMFASVDEFTIKIQGTGGHAAHPESLIDPDIGRGAGCECTPSDCGSQRRCVGGCGAEHRDDKGRDGVQHNP